MIREFRSSRVLRAGILLGIAQSSLSAFAPMWMPLQEAHAASQGYSDAEMAKVESSQELQIRQTREAELKEIRKLLALRLPGNRKADLYVRQAELYFEAYRQEFLLEGRVHEKRVSSGGRSSLLTGRSRSYLIKGIQAAEEILVSGLAIPQKDRLYFMLGYHHSEAGNEKESLRYYQTLVRDYPRSTFAGEAYRELGEVAFADRNFVEAKRAFDLALPILRAKIGQDPQAGLAAARVLHKLGWTHYRQKRVDLAIQSLQASVSQALALGELGSGVKEESLRDLAVFMTEAGRVDDALLYFEKASGGDKAYPRLLEKLGKQYERQVEPIKAIQVYEAILKSSPTSDEAVRARARLVEIDLKQGNFEGALAHVSPIQLRMELLTGETESETSVAARNLRSKIRRTATDLHEKARKSEDKNAQAQWHFAERFYQIYLDRFLAISDPKKESLEIRMYLAEIKRELGKPSEASQLYVEVIRSEDEKFSKEASALWLGALAEGLKKTQTSDSRGGREGTPSAKELEFISASEKVLKLLPESREARQGTWQSARILADYKKTEDDAIEKVDVLLDRYPGSEEAHLGARLWVQLLEDRLPSGAVEIPGSREAGNLRDAMNRLRGIPALFTTDQQKKNALKLKLAALESRLDLGDVARSEKKEDFVSAARGYERFARTQKAGSEGATQAYSSAVASYLKAGDVPSARTLFQSWTAEEASRKSDGARKVILRESENLSLALMAQGQTAAAAELSDQQWNRFKGELGPSEQVELWAQSFRYAIAAQDEARLGKLLKSVPTQAAVFEVIAPVYRRELIRGSETPLGSSLASALKSLKLSEQQRGTLDSWEKEGKLGPNDYRNEAVALLARELEASWKKRTGKVSFRGKKIKEALDLRLAELEAAQKKIDTLGNSSADLLVEAARLRSMRIAVLAGELQAEALKPDPIWGEQTVKTLRDLQKGLEESADGVIVKTLALADENSWISFDLYSLRQEVHSYIPVLSPWNVVSVPNVSKDPAARLLRNLRDADAWAESAAYHYRLGKREHARWCMERSLALNPQAQSRNSFLRALDLEETHTRLSHRAALEEYVSLQKMGGGSQAGENPLWKAYLELRIGLPVQAARTLEKIRDEDQDEDSVKLLQRTAALALGRTADPLRVPEGLSASQALDWEIQSRPSLESVGCESLKSWVTGTASSRLSNFYFKSRIKELWNAALQRKGCAS